MATERYSFSLTTFSPSGKLVQIEYALAAVAAGAPSVGIKASNGVVIATENKHKSILYDEHSVNKVEMITSHIGMVYSGMGPDYRLLLVQRVAAVMQEYTQSGGVRPFGCDPSGAYFAWKATAMGKNFINGKTFLEKRYSEDLELDDAVHTAILTLKESFEGQMTADNIEVGICDQTGFKRLDPSNVKDYLANIP
ncbi:Proteasome subunit A N-terminal signature [Popillia japonica]|uniref:Proteasome subunit alpha type n=1 Tax=Popillia japonica TaxID=7064 RepID=A0AAW1LEZ8_POPJA